MSDNMGEINGCPICNGGTESNLDPQLHCCRNCGFWFSTFSENPHRLAKATDLNESNRIEALRGLRLHNFHDILNLLGRLMDLHGKRLLDVGCAYGWFLALAQEQGLRCLGIEPEAAIAQQGQRDGLPIRIGYFPDCLDAEEQFEIIIFNDVLEHLADVPSVMAVCRDRLAARGILVINAPSSRGILFRVALFLARFGVKGPLNRLWQRHFHSPHLSYFNDFNLSLLAQKCGFRLKCSRSLCVLKWKGMWSRVRMDERAGLPFCLLIYSLLVLGYPILAVCPSDILLHVYEKPE